MKRRLAAILAADMVGYTRLMGEDEAGTLRRLTDLRRRVLEPLIAEHHGRVVKLMGDGLLVDFFSVVDAATCAVAWQNQVAEEEAASDDANQLRFRIGINLGDVIVEGDDIHGDGVNIAARLEGLAEPGEICFSGDAYRQVRGKIEADFEDLGERDLKNVAEPVRVYRIRALRSDSFSSVQHEKALPLPDKPSIAVLPFDNFSGDSEQDYFADGITEDIITELARWKEFSVIARNSSFTYKGSPVKVQQVAAELGVRYVIEGSVRKVGDRVRISAQLIDAATSHHVWADRFDKSGEDVLSLQDEVTEMIVATLGGDLGEIRKGEYSRAWQRPAASLEEYDYFLRGHQIFYGFTPDAMSRARDIWLEGLEKYPNSGLLHIKVGWTHALSAIFGWADPNEALPVAFALVDDGLGDPALPPAGQRYGLWLRATLYLWFMRDPDRALREAQATIDLFPYDSETFALLAPLPAYAGEPARAIEWMETSLATEPTPWDIGRLHYGKVLYMAEQYDAAHEWLIAMEQPNFDSLRYLAASCAALDRMDEAQSAVRQFQEIVPPINLTQLRAVLPYRNEPDLERELAHLRKAGLPE